MLYAKLGDTPYTVSRICTGSLTVSPLGAGLSLAAGAAVLREAWEMGVNFLDTAQYYQNYGQIRESLKGFPKDVIIATKSYATTYEEMKAAVEEARRGLDRDQIEIFLLHQQRSAQAILENLPALHYLHDAKAKGLIGACGISTHNVAAARQAALMPEIEVIHPMINKMGIGVNGGTLEEMIAAVKLAYANGKGVYGMKAIGGGSLMSQAKEMLAWAFSRDFMHSVAVGMKDKLEVAANIGWLLGQDPPQAALIGKIDRNLVFDPPPCCTGCGNCYQACPQGALKEGPGQPLWLKEKCIYCGYCIPVCEKFCISFA